MMQGYGWYGETMWMGDWGLTHGVMMVALLALILYPVGLILRRLGYSPYGRRSPSCRSLIWSACGLSRSTSGGRDDLHGPIPVSPASTFFAHCQLWFAACATISASSTAPPKAFLSAEAAT